MAAPHRLSREGLVAGRAELGATPKHRMYEHFIRMGLHAITNPNLDKLMRSNLRQHCVNCQLYSLNDRQRTYLDLLCLQFIATTTALEALNTEVQQK